jgi:hypothetical protein
MRLAPDPSSARNVQLELFPSCTGGPLVLRWRPDGELGGYCGHCGRFLRDVAQTPAALARAPWKPGA